MIIPSNFYDDIRNELNDYNKHTVLALFDSLINAKNKITDCWLDCYSSNEHPLTGSKYRPIYMIKIKPMMCMIVNNDIIINNTHSLLIKYLCILKLHNATIWQPRDDDSTILEHVATIMIQKNIIGEFDLVLKGNQKSNYSFINDVYNYKSSNSLLIDHYYKQAYWQIELTINDIVEQTLAITTSNIAPFNHLAHKFNQYINYGLYVNNSLANDIEILKLDNDIKILFIYLYNKFSDSYQINIKNDTTLDQQWKMFNSVVLSVNLGLKWYFDDSNDLFSKGIYPPLLPIIKSYLNSQHYLKLLYSKHWYPLERLLHFHNPKNISKELLKEVCNKGTYYSDLPLCILKKILWRYRDLFRPYFLSIGIDKQLLLSTSPLVSSPLVS